MHTIGVMITIRRRSSAMKANKGLFSFVLSINFTYQIALLKCISMKSINEVLDKRNKVKFLMNVFFEFCKIVFEIAKIPCCHYAIKYSHVHVTPKRAAFRSVSKLFVPPNPSKLTVIVCLSWKKDKMKKNKTNQV